MIIKEMRIIECWCECGTGQVAQILQRSFEEKKSLKDYIGQHFTCPNCKQENVIEDILQMIPENFLVTSQVDISSYKRAKMNNDLDKFLNT